MYVHTDLEVHKLFKLRCIKMMYKFVFIKLLVGLFPSYSCISNYNDIISSDYIKYYPMKKSQFTIVVYYNCLCSKTSMASL